MSIALRKPSCPFHSQTPACHPLEKPLKLFHGHLLRSMDSGLLSGSVVQIVTRLALIVLCPLIYPVLGVLAFSAHLKAKWWRAIPSQRVVQLGVLTDGSAKAKRRVCESPKRHASDKGDTSATREVSVQQKMLEEMNDLSSFHEFTRVRLFTRFDFSTGEENYFGSYSQLLSLPTSDYLPFITECSQSALRTAIHEMHVDNKEMIDMVANQSNWVALFESHRGRFYTLSGTRHQSPSGSNSLFKEWCCANSKNFNKIVQACIKPLGFSCEHLLDKEGHLAP